MTYIEIKIEKIRNGYLVTFITSYWEWKEAYNYLKNVIESVNKQIYEHFKDCEEEEK